MKYVIALVVIGLAVVGVYQNSDAIVSPFIREVELVDQPAPEYFFVSDLAGQSHELGELRGKTSMIVVWATWCERCPAILRKAEQLQRDYADQNVKIVTFNIDVLQGNADPRDHSGGSAANVSVFRDKEGITLPIWLPTGKGATGLFPATAGGYMAPEFKMPEVYILDPGLHVRWHAREPYTGALPVALKEVLASQKRN